VPIYQGGFLAQAFEDSQRGTYISQYLQTVLLFEFDCHCTFYSHQSITIMIIILKITSDGVIQKNVRYITSL